MSAASLCAALKDGAATPSICGDGVGKCAGASACGSGSPKELNFGRIFALFGVTRSGKKDEGATYRVDCKTEPMDADGGGAGEQPCLFL